MAPIAQKYLINKATFGGFEDVSINIDPTRLNVFIKKAQDLDLKPFMGGVFYYDMIKQVILNENGTINVAEGQTPAIYADLLQGTEWADKRGNLQYLPGLISALVYFTFARFIEADSIHYTATGPVIKQRDDSDNLKSADITKLVIAQRGIANSYINEVISFLNCKKSEYIYWQYNAQNTRDRSAGVRITGIDKTRVNNPNYRDRNGFLSGLI